MLYRSSAFENSSSNSHDASASNALLLQQEGVQASPNIEEPVLPVSSAEGTLITRSPSVKAPNSTAPPVEHPSSAVPFKQVQSGLWFYVECGLMALGQSNIKDIANGLMKEFAH